MSTITHAEFMDRYEYDINAPINDQGTQGTIYKAYDKKTGEWLALKRSPVRVGRLSDYSIRREWSRAKDFDHTNLLEYRDIYRIEIPNIGMYDFGLMELVPDGLNITQFIKQSPPTESEQLILQLLPQILYGLSYLHQRDIIHRDIKPGNILIKRDEQDQPIVKIIDFGISKDIIEGATAIDPSGLIGTVAYMAPEQIRGSKMKKNADLWSLGVILCKLVTGRSPFGLRSETYTEDEIRNRILDFKPLIDFSTIPEPFRYIIEGCLKVDIYERFQTAGELLKVLEDHITDLIDHGVFTTLYSYSPDQQITNRGGQSNILACHRVNIPEEPLALKWNYLKDGPKANSVVQHEWELRQRLGDTGFPIFYDWYRIKNREQHFAFGVLDLLPDAIPVHQFVKQLDPSIKRDVLYSLLHQLLKAVRALHQIGYAHGQLSPNIILVNLEAQLPVLYLFDLSPAQSVIQPAEPETIVAIGEEQIAYQPPERIDGAAPSFQTDIWSIGAIFFELCAGYAPFGNVAAQSLESVGHSILNYNLARNEWPNFDEPFAALISACMQPSLTDRFSKIDELSQLPGLRHTITHHKVVLPAPTEEKDQQSPTPPKEDLPEPTVLIDEVIAPAAPDRPKQAVVPPPIPADISVPASEKNVEPTGVAPVNDPYRTKPAPIVRPEKISPPVIKPVISSPPPITTKTQPKLSQPTAPPSIPAAQPDQLSASDASNDRLRTILIALSVLMLLVTAYFAYKIYAHGQYDPHISYLKRCVEEEGIAKSDTESLETCFIAQIETYINDKLVPPGDKQDLVGGEVVISFEINKGGRVKNAVVLSDNIQNGALKIGQQVKSLIENMTANGYTWIPSQSATGPQVYSIEYTHLFKESYQSD